MLLCMFRRGVSRVLVVNRSTGPSIVCAQDIQGFLIYILANPKVLVPIVNEDPNTSHANADWSAVLTYAGSTALSNGWSKR